jgi:hypothetical protein
MAMPNSADTIARHLAFWRRDEVERPLLGVYLGSYMSADIYKVAQEGELLQPAQLEPERFFDSLAEQLAQLDGLDQDLIVPAQPISSVPWLEAMFGSPVRVSNQAVWAETLLESSRSSNFPAGGEAWAKPPAFRPPGGTFWVAGAAGPFLRGPADVLAGLLGANRLAIELMDHPAQVQRLAELCAQRWVEVTHRILAEIPPWKGGYVHGARWIYAPEPCSYASEDITQLFSPRTYREIFLPYNRWMTEQVPYGFWHRHAPSQHHLEALTGLPASWAIEVTIDPSNRAPSSSCLCCNGCRRQGSA